MFVKSNFQVADVNCSDFISSARCLREFQDLYGIYPRERTTLRVGGTIWLSHKLEDWINIGTWPKLVLAFECRATPCLVLQPIQIGIWFSTGKFNAMELQIRVLSLREVIPFSLCSVINPFIQLSISHVCLGLQLQLRSFNSSPVSKSYFYCYDN